MDITKMNREILLTKDEINVKVIEMLSGEADDYISCRAEQYDSVLSNDKDLWPLLDKGVNILVNATTKVDAALVQVKFNASAKHIYLYKALVGDPSDKIPGKRGFGKAAWAKLDYTDRELYSYHFSRLGGCSYDPELMTKEACMSWKLARPYCEYAFSERVTIAENPAEFCIEKGIIL